MPDPTPFVRPYDASRDFENGMHVYLSTISPTLNYTPARTIGAHLWYTPYVTLSPTSCFILDSGTGRAVGYCIGTFSTLSFSQRWRSEYIKTVDKDVVPPPDVVLTASEPEMESDEIKHFRNAVYKGECSMLLPWHDELDRFPAHLHIDILDEYQRKGWGTVLMRAFFDKAREEGVEGVHLDMVRENQGARRFYERLGFGVCGRVLDGGESGETGVNGIVVTLVKEL